VFNEKRSVIIVSSSDKLTNIFIKYGYDVVTIEDENQLLYVLEETAFDLAIFDFSYGVTQLKELLTYFAKSNYNDRLPILGIFESQHKEGIDEYIDRYIDGFLTIPYLDRELIVYAEQLIELEQSRKAIEEKELIIASLRREVTHLTDELKMKSEENKELSGKISRISVLDILTGLFNRTYALEQLDMAISRFNRNRIVSSVIMCNIDNFNTINIEYGQNIGDQVIREVALTLT